MKKSNVAIGVIVALGAAWVGGAWFTGQTAETEYKRQIEQANQQLQALGVSDSFNMAIKNKSFERGLFSSQVEDEIVVSLPQEQKTWAIPFSTKVYHGPLPLNQLAKFNLAPAMFAAEGFIAKSESTQPLFDVIKSDKPIQYHASTSYSLSTKGGLDIAGGEFVNADNTKEKITWSNLNFNFDLNKELAGNYDFAMDDLAINLDGKGESLESNQQINLESMQMQWKGVKSEGTLAPTKWSYIYTGNGTSAVDSFAMTSRDQSGKILSFVEKGIKATSEISAEGDFLNLKMKSSTDSLNLDNKELGKVVYNLEFNHIEGNAVNALMETAVKFLQIAKDNPDNGDEIIDQLVATWLETHSEAIFNNQPQIKFNPISISDEEGKLALDLNIALAQNPKFDLLRGNLYKQFKDFAVDIQLDKATAENLLKKLAPAEDAQMDFKAKIEEFAAEGESNGFAVNSEKSVTMKLVLENGELKLNGNVVPEEQVKGIIFMLLMGAAMQR